uniref:Uncharacterized protein n=1 Tax=Rhizophora mucronata TaxID=61149 RepID=A0A2P2QL34_RHIMU
MFLHKTKEPSYILNSKKIDNYPVILYSFNATSVTYASYIQQHGKTTYSMCKNKCQCKV